MGFKLPIINNNGKPKELTSNDDLRIPSAVQFAKGATPATPASGYVNLYFNSDNELLYKKDTGGEGKIFTPQFALSVIFDGGGSVITVGTKIGVYTAFDFGIYEWTLGSIDGTSGSIEVDIWVDTHANFPPVVADSICSTGTKPNISSGTKGQSTTFTNWTTTSISAGRWIFFNVHSVASLKLVSVNLFCKKSN
ncbi:MAG: hypothetical protein HOP11_14360 [Saprospiraceae bacterium]|nr:hypothetical protein [Saprospiraceae bacterium]